MSAAFDWYEVTVPVEVPELLSVLEEVPGALRWERLKGAPHGYAFGDRLVDVDGTLVEVWWGGIHAHPHARASSDAAQVVAEILRERLPIHSVSRVDVKIDYGEPGAYERLQAIAVDVARDHRVKLNTAGDHLLTKQARTVYVGSRQSPTMMRVYEKADELRVKFAKDPARLAQVPAELARVELQIRPATPAAKRVAAQAAPLALMGSAKWAREYMKRVGGLDLEPVEMGRSWRQADDQRAWAALLAQYGGLLTRVKESLGAWDCLGLQIGHDLAERVREGRGQR